VLVGAVLPGLGYAVLLLWIARAARVRVRPAVVAFALVWGAGVAAPVASLANALLQARGWSLALVGVPPVEEAAKAAVLVALVLFWRTAVRDVRAGIVLGGLVGLGFAQLENLGYLLLARVQDGPAGLLRAIAVRGILEGAVHPVFTATTGAGLGAALTRRRVAPGLFGFAAAVTQHALWNGVASGAVNAVLCNGVTPTGACRGNPDAAHIILTVPFVVAASLAPGIIALTALARSANPRAGESS
jgi:protease PrsW